MLGFELPYTADEINAACMEVLKVNNFTDAYMRPVAWRGAESMGVAPGNTQPHIAIAAWEWGKYYDRGIRKTASGWTSRRGAGPRPTPPRPRPRRRACT